MYVWVAALNVLVVALKVLIVRPIKDDSAFGVFFWFQVTDFDRFLGFFSLCHLIFLAIYLGLFLVCVGLTPKGSCCPPLTSFSGIRSSRRINLSAVRLRLLIPDSSAGAFFLFFGAFTLFLS